MKTNEGGTMNERTQLSIVGIANPGDDGTQTSTLETVVPAAMPSSVIRDFADRIENALLGDLPVWLDNVGVEIERSAPKTDLETFTVFGNNDDLEDFVAVVTATEETVIEEGKKAGLAYAGFEDCVDIVLVVKGDHSNAEVVNV